MSQNAEKMRLARREFIGWLCRIAGGCTVTGAVIGSAPLTRINTTLFAEAYAQTSCTTDTCTTRDKCESGDAEHTCQQKDTCTIDESGDCVSDVCQEDKSSGCANDECDIDKSGACTGDSCSSDSSGNCQSDSCLSDASGECKSDQCGQDSSSPCQSDTCDSDSSGDYCANDTCTSDSSGYCISDNCGADSSGECISDQCEEDKSGDCQTDECVTDKSGVCANDTCLTDSSGSCNNTDLCESDASGSCQVDQCSGDSSKACTTADYCSTDSSGSCSTDRCESDASGDCGADVCILDLSKGTCANDLCREDRTPEGVQCNTDTCALDLADNTPRSRRRFARAGFNEALKLLYKLTLIVLFLHISAGQSPAATAIDARDALMEPAAGYVTSGTVSVTSPVGPFLRDCDNDGILEADVNGDGLCAGDPEVRDYNGDGTRELPDGTSFTGDFRFTCFYIPDDVAITTTGLLTVRASQEMAVFGTMRLSSGGQFSSKSAIDLRTSSWLSNGGSIIFTTSQAGEVDESRTLDFTAALMIPAVPYQSACWQNENVASLSGKILQNDGTTPVPYPMQVLLYKDGCGGTAMGNAAVQPDGSYTLRGLVSGTYYLQASYKYSSYFPEWWSSGGDSFTCGEAGGLTMTTGQTTADVNILMNDCSNLPNGATNDNFSDYITISAGSGSQTTNNYCATAEEYEPDHTGSGAKKSLWWRWTAPAAGQYTLSTTGSAIDTALAVYTGYSVSALTLVGKNDNFGSNAWSRLSFTAQKSKTYVIAVDSMDGTGGTIVLSEPRAGGDVNGDGAVDLNDLMLALKAVANVPGATGINVNADVNGDGRIGLAEALYILQVLAGRR